MQKISKLLVLLVKVVLIVLLDQLIELIFVKSQFGHIGCNSGIGFGLDLGRFGPIILSSAIIVMVLSALIYLEIQNRKRELIFPLVLVAAGALSNLLDRITRGCVIDYINLKIWPSFNLADALITFGLAWVIILLFLRTDS